MDRGQFKDVPPAIREWFENMRSPKGIACCSYADGHRTGYDIRQGQYWVPIEGEWYPVPPGAVIKTENPVGEAIVWYLHQAGPEGELPRSDWYKIVCFVPSGDTTTPSWANCRLRTAISIRGTPNSGRQVQLTISWYRQGMDRRFPPSSRATRLRPTQASQSNHRSGDRLRRRANVFKTPSFVMTNVDQ
jgi:hypothetical protein